MVTTTRLPPREEEQDHLQKTQYGARAGFGSSRFVAVAHRFASKRSGEVRLALEAGISASLSSKIFCSVAKNGLER